jgi:hypothetical protein
MAIEDRHLPVGTRLVANFKKQTYVYTVEAGEGEGLPSSSKTAPAPQEPLSRWLQGDGGQSGLSTRDGKKPATSRRGLLATGSLVISASVPVQLGRLEITYVHWWLRPKLLIHRMSRLIAAWCFTDLAQFRGAPGAS